MSSTDDRDRYICELYAAGRSAISIGAEMGMSRSQVHRIVAAGAPVVDTELDDDEGVVDDLYDDAVEHWPVEPLTFVGYGRQ